MAIIMLGVQWDDQITRICIIIGMPTQAFPLGPPLTVIYMRRREKYTSAEGFSTGSLSRNMFGWV